MDGVDAAEDAVAHELGGDAELFRRALLRAGLENAVGLAHLLHELDGLADIVGEGLFAVDIFAGADGGDGDVGVPVVGRGDDNDVDIFAGDDLAEIVIRGAAGVGAAGLGGVGGVHGFLGVLAAGGVDVADGEHLDIVTVEVAAEMAAHHFAHADAADGEALARGGLG